MPSKNEWSALPADHHINVNGPPPDWMKSWVRQQGGIPTKPTMPPRSQVPKPGEQSPLLPPMPQSVLPHPIKQSSSKARGHGRSRSEFMLAASQSDLTHRPNKGVPPMPVGAGCSSRSSRPPRSSNPNTVPPPVHTNPVISSLGSSPQGTPNRRDNAHRRAKSDIPLVLLGGGDNSIGGDGRGGVVGGRLITKAELLNNFPDPRWGGAKKPLAHTRNRSRTGSDSPLLDSASVGSGGGLSGYGATASSGGGSIGNPHPLLQSIGSVELPPDARRFMTHIRTKSDASIQSVTTDLGKSAMFKGVTDSGRIQLQLPKDNHRLLMDSALEVGSVYKRKLVENEDEFFVEFHTVDEDGIDHAGESVYQERTKSLPTDLYVLAVDGTLYRRMLDEVIESRTMPCGTFFCGHHEDVSHPDITIAAIIVGMVIILLAASMIYTT